MKVFLDSNVIVSAFAARGLCADLLRHVLARHELLVGEVVAAEVRRTLVDKLKASPKGIAAVESVMRQSIVVPRPENHLDLGLEDPDDEWVVASAIAGGADVLVTGDRRLLDHADPPLPLLTPRQFWEHVRGGG